MQQFKYEKYGQFSFQKMRKGSSRLFEFMYHNLVYQIFANSESYKDVQNAVSSKPKFTNPSEKIRYYFDNWESDELFLTRFLVPSKYCSLVQYHKVFIVCSKQNDDSQQHIRPDYYYRQKIRDYICSCGVGLRQQGSCVHIQTVLYGAQISINDKKNFQRSFSALGADNFMAKYEQSVDEEEEHQFPGNNFLIITSDQLLNIKC